MRRGMTKEETEKRIKVMQAFVDGIPFGVKVEE